MVLRASRLPLVRSAMESMTLAYSGVKVRYPLLGLVGGVAEVGVRSVSLEAMRRATPLLQSLEPQIEAANSFALVGLDRLEKNFPVLNQSADEVVGHLKDAFFLTLDDVQSWVVEGMDGALDQMERLAEATRVAVKQLQETPVGKAATSSLDEVLSRLEDATAYYLPLPPTLRREWEMRVQEYEDEDEDDEPSLWTRVRSLLLTLSMQFYHRMTKVREQLQRAIKPLGDAADRVGLGRVLELLGDLLMSLQSFLVALVYQVEGLRGATLSRVRGQAALLAELRPVRQVRELPLQVQQLLGDLQELSRLLLQLVVNATPLYDLLEKPSSQEVDDFLNQEDFAGDSSSRRSSGTTLFLKAMDGRPRRRRSLYSLAGRSSGLPQSPPAIQTSQSPDPPPAVRRRSSAKEQAAPDPDSLQVPESATAYRRPSATELLLTPLKQFVAQSQKAFEYLSPASPEEQDPTPNEEDDL